MSNTVKGIIENFLIMVKTYGLVPNGGRIYYTKRSQPPYLTLMMKEYIDKTADVQFLRTQLPTLTRELDFWEDRRSVEVEKNGKSYTLFIFGTGGTGPRPESYREDVEFAESFETEAEREDFYYHMKAGAESGWDYSTRWFINKNVRIFPFNFFLPFFAHISDTGFRVEIMDPLWMSKQVTFYRWI